MNTTYITQLLNFLGTPYGIILVAAGIVLIVQASRSRKMGWLLFSLCCFAASLNKLRDEWTLEPPALVFPLQQIRNVGRPLAIVLLIALAIVALSTRNSWRRKIFPKPIDYLIVVQALIMCKTLLYGSIEFAILSAMTFGGIIFVLKHGPGQWLNNDDNFKLAARSIAIVGSIFVTLNTYQYILNPIAVTFKQGRFLGTTGNPQHAAVLLAAIIPSLMFLFQRIPNWNFIKFLWMAMLIGVMYFLLLTGSRTGLLMGAISILLFYRNNGGAWLRLALALSFIAALVMPFLEPSTLNSSVGIDANVSARFSSLSNTRADVWSSLWRSFIENPVFGAPLYSSWLSAAANLGLVGFIPMALMGWESLKLMWELNLLSQRKPAYFFQASMVIAGLGSLLLGSFFEAFLLGNITFSLLAFLTYLLMAAYLLEVDRARTYYARMRASASIEEQSAGVYQ
jgi:hypothetical protein